MPIFIALFLACLLPASLAQAAEPPVVRVRLETSAGAITVALDTNKAPKTSANFLAYVDDGRLDGTTFYRAARARTDPKRGFIQGGIDTDARRMIVPPVVLEPTDKTGIRHLDGTISMARKVDPDSATGNFSLTVGPAPMLDANGVYRGYAAFGRVVGGMDVVKRILAMPSGGGQGPMRGQMLFKPVTITRAVRLDGKPGLTSPVKPWLIYSRQK